LTNTGDSWSSRVAAQIVSGIGFIGAGLIFVQRDVVRGLTTACGPQKLSHAQEGAREYS